MGGWVRVRVRDLESDSRLRRAGRRDWPREPDHREMNEAYFNARYAGDAGDWADLAYELSIRRG